MKPERKAPQPEESLHELLEAAENRKSEELKQKSKWFSLVVYVPVVALLLWAAIFLITYDKAPATANAAESTSELTPKPSGVPQFDIFRDEEDRAVKTNALGLKKTSGKLIDKGDIQFAIELLNFGRVPPDSPKDE